MRKGIASPRHAIFSHDAGALYQRTACDTFRGNLPNLASLQSILPATRTGRVLLGLFLLCGTALRFINLGEQSFWLDEVYSACIVEGPVSQILSSIPKDKPPLGYYAQAFFTRFGDDKEFLHRIPAAISGSLFLFFMYLLATRFFSPRVGVIALGLASFNTFLIMYAQEARPYSLSLLLITINLLCFVEWLRGGRIRWLVALTISAILSCYALYAGLAIIGAEFVALLIPALRSRSRADGRRLVHFLGSCAVLSLSLIVLQSRASIYPSKNFLWTFTAFAPGQFTRVFLHTLVGVIPVAEVFGALAGVAATVAGVIACVRLRSRSHVVLFATVFITVVMPFFYWHINRTIFPRYTIFLVPGLLVLIAAGIEFAIARFSPMRAGANALLLVGGLLYIPASTWFFFHPVGAKVGWKGASQYIAARAATNDVVAVSSGMETTPLAYYLRRFGRPDLQVQLFDPNLPDDQLSVSWVVLVDNSKTARNYEFPYIRMQHIRQNPPEVDPRVFLSRMKEPNLFNIGALPEELLGGGWSYVEIWEGNHPMRWSIGRTCTLFLPMESDGGGEVVLNVMPFEFKSGAPQSVALVINGVAMEQRELKGGGFRDVVWEVPAGAIKKGYNHVAIRFARAQTLSDFKSNVGEVRPLSGVVNWIKWCPAKDDSQ
ncbi:glycosyltransferase family 39 protein [Candidatus Sumerlaeota bacterium]|nr:glycosyltransferase family 39 protein [Candidatus Sumerlaeota bacterium]